MPSINVTWKAVMDEKVCPICRALNGYTWTFITGKDSMGNSLVHPQFGIVWDVHRGSQAHGHLQYNCRCHIEPQIDIDDLRAKIQQLLDACQEGLRFEVFERYGKPVGVYREISTGRFAARP